MKYAAESKVAQKSMADRLKSIFSIPVLRRSNTAKPIADTPCQSSYISRDVRSNRSTFKHKTEHELKTSKYHAHKLKHSHQQFKRKPSTKKASAKRGEFMQAIGLKSNFKQQLTQHLNVSSPMKHTPLSQPFQIPSTTETIPKLTINLSSMSVVKNDDIKSGPKHQPSTMPAAHQNKWNCVRSNTPLIQTPSTSELLLTNGMSSGLGTGSNPESSLTRQAQGLLINDINQSSLSIHGGIFTESLLKMHTKLIDEVSALNSESDNIKLDTTMRISIELEHAKILNQMASMFNNRISAIKELHSLEIETLVATREKRIENLKKAHVLKIEELNAEINKKDAKILRLQEQHNAPTVLQKYQNLF